MKKFYSWMTVMAVALSFGFTSCSDDDDNGSKEPDPVPVAAAELKSFSFTEANNPEALSADYVGTISEVDKTVRVTMPAFADKSSLIATFTVGEDNTVTVNGVTQTSGVTANDFNAPVDYIISNADGTQNLKYTVIVEKAANYAWSEAARFTATVPGGSPVMKINPTDNTPYLALVGKSDKKVHVYKFVEGAFASVGSDAGESGDVTSNRMDFAISNDGTPYYIYSDASATDLKSSPTVMKFNGASWENVGNPGLVGFVPSKVQIGVIGSEVIAPMIVNANKGSFGKREMYASIFSSGTWTTSSLASVGMTSGTVECITTTDNAAYLYSTSAPDADKKAFYSVAEYKNGVWTALRSNYIDAGATQPPVLIAGGASIVASNDGTVYLLTGDDADSGNTGDMGFKVLKYSPDTKDWTLIGGAPLTAIRANDTHITAKLAIAPDGTIFLAFTDYKGNKLAKVQYFDNETKQWTNPVVLSTEEADDINIGFCDNGEAYITFTGNDDNIVLMKYAAKN